MGKTSNVTSSPSQKHVESASKPKSAISKPKSKSGTLQGRTIRLCKECDKPLPDFYFTDKNGTAIYQYHAACWQTD